VGSIVGVPVSLTTYLLILLFGHPPLSSQLP
jgi:hypothetical protein